MRYASIFFGAVLLGGLVVLWYGNASYRKPVQKEAAEKVRVEVMEGDDVWTIAQKLEKAGIIDSKIFFVAGAWQDGLLGTFRSGMYLFSRSISPADMALSLSRGEALLRDVRVTFPEGWTIDEMAKRLNEKGLAGDIFSEISKHPSDAMRTQYDFLATLPDGASLEGFLFPDTYYFLPETTGEDIVNTMLETFDKKTFALKQECLKQQKNFFALVTMASILEGEVRTDNDRSVVSGIFWKRIASDMRLQSDATLDYILQSGKIQHGVKDLETDSPYNTYRYAGLPPGPVGNPSLSALDAALHPTDSSYLYFLSDPQTGKTYFAKDFEEHKANKIKVGL